MGTPQNLVSRFGVTSTPKQHLIQSFSSHKTAKIKVFEVKTIFFEKNHFLSPGGFVDAKNTSRGLPNSQDGIRKWFLTILQKEKWKSRFFKNRLRKANFQAIFLKRFRPKLHVKAFGRHEIRFRQCWYVFRELFYPKTICTPKIRFIRPLEMILQPQTVTPPQYSTFRKRTL